MAEKGNYLCKGLIIGSVVGVAMVLLNSSSRKKVVNGITEVREFTSGLTKLLKENRAEVLQQIKETSSEFADTIKQVSEDVKKITESANHIKESSNEIVQSAKEAMEEIKQLKGK